MRCGFEAVRWFITALRIPNCANWMLFDAVASITGAAIYSSLESSIV
jgi:hypothetical protein